AIARLREAFAGDLVVKRGASGAWLVRRGGVRVERVPAPRVRAINTVGAGDTCNGTLLAALAAGADWPRALRLAVAAASRMVASPQGVGGLVRRHTGA
ncbi:MAG: carbohydrate kinase family protein, partial [Opitutaceae bacterium]|nr:carbohydrate kinase family protein [Opitutaceae bacterium]